MQIKQGLRLIYSGSVTQANNKLASNAGGSMWDTGVDLSAYAGDDAGSTPHLLVLYDSAGKRLQGFIGASGGGEALGAELVVNGDFANWTGDDPDDWIIGGEDANNYVTESPAGVCNLVSDNTAVVNFQQHPPTTVSRLYKLIFNVTINTLGWRYTFTVVGRELANSTDTGAMVFYGTNTSNGLRFYRHNESPCDFEVDNISLKQVTEVSATGVHLHSTKGGTNRNVASIDAAFDPNDLAGFTFNIYSCP